MPSTSNTAVVRRFLDDVWNANKLAIADELVRPDYEVEGIGTGPSAVKRNVAAYRATFPDLACTIDQIVAEGDWVAVRLTLRGTQLGPLGEIPATGRAVAFKEMVFWHVRDGRLRAIWSIGDALGLRVQLGALPASAWRRPVSVDGAAVDATPAREDGPPGTPPDGW